MRPLKILEGIRIVTFAASFRAAYGIQVLADMGADVIRVETPEGFPERSHAGMEAFQEGVSLLHVALGRNYRDIVLDPVNPSACRAAIKLASEADVLIEDTDEDVMKAAGLDYETIRRVNPDVIYVSCTGYGDDPYDPELPGEDLLVQAMTGLADCCGSMDGPPQGIGAPVVDVHTGTLMALGTVGALFRRIRTGEGQKICVNMIQAAMNLQLEGMTYSLNGIPIRRALYHMADGYSKTPYGVFRTKDGYIALSISPIADYYEATDHDPRLYPYLDPHAAWAYRREIQEAFTEIMKERATEEWTTQLRRHGIWMQVVNSETECLKNPIIQAVHAVTEADHPRAGKVQLLKHPVNYGCGEMEIRYLAPEAGEHSEEILHEAGYTEEEIKTILD